MICLAGEATPRRCRGTTSCKDFVGVVLVEKIIGNPKLLALLLAQNDCEQSLASHPKVDEWALQQAGSSERTRRRKLASAESRRLSRPAFPLPVLGKLSAAFSFERSKQKSCRKTGFDLFLTIVLTGSGRLPSDTDAHWQLAARKDGLLPKQVCRRLQFSFAAPLVFFLRPRAETPSNSKKRFAHLYCPSAPAPFSRGLGNVCRLRFFIRLRQRKWTHSAHSPDKSGGRTEALASGAPVLRRDCDVFFLLLVCTGNAGFAFRRGWRCLSFRTWRKAGEPFPSFSRTDGSSFRRLEPVEQQFLQTAIQEYVPIVKTTLKPEVRIFTFQFGRIVRRVVFRGKLPAAGIRKFRPPTPSLSGD